MMKSEFYFPSADGKTNIHAVEWLPEGKPAAVLQIAHGMTEHILRYEEFAEYLTGKRIAVVGNDHIGHGTSIAEGAQPMYFGTSGSWGRVVRDLHTCHTMTEEKFPDIPHVMLGFSLGSFLVRTYLIEYPGEADAAILMGTGQISQIGIFMAKMVANREAEKVGEEYPSPVVTEMTFGTYNKKFWPNRTECDWLCASNESLDDYISDPLRGEALSVGLFRELLDGMAFTGKMKNIRKMRKNLPVLFVSGDKDPVGDFGKGVRKAYRRFKEAGMGDVSLKLYPELRHMVLSEDCREEVYRYLYRWIKKKVIIRA